MNKSIPLENILELAFLQTRIDFLPSEMSREDWLKYTSLRRQFRHYQHQVYHETHKIDFQKYREERA